MRNPQNQPLGSIEDLVMGPQAAWVFLDEATSPLGEPSQRRAISIFDRELVNTTVLSIGHRPGLEQFHKRILHLVHTPDGARLHNADQVAAIANADGKIEIFGQRTAVRA